MNIYAGAVGEGAGKKAKRYTAKIDGRPVGTGAEMRRVPLSSIRGDIYQRDVSTEWLRVNGPWDENRAGVVLLSSRAGGPYCIDGQHRIRLAQDAKATHVNAFVVDGLTQADEAAMFVASCRSRRNLNEWALWKAEIIGQMPEAVEIQRITLAANFRISPSSAGDRNIKAVGGLRRIYRLGGATLLGRTLATISDALWVGETRALTGQVLYGLALFLDSASPDNRFKNKHLTDILQRNGPSKLVLRAQTIALRRGVVSVGSGSVASAILELYNTNLPSIEKLNSDLTISGRKQPTSPRPPLKGKG